MGLSSNAGSSARSSTRSTSSFSSQQDAYRTTATTPSAWVPSTRDSERNGVWTLGGGMGVGGASHDRRSLSTTSAGSSFTAGHYQSRGREAEKTGGTTHAAGGGGGASLTRHALVRGAGVAEDANASYRSSMEDRFVICNPLASVGGVFLGVFDGHGGAGAADFAAEVIQHNFTNELKRARHRGSSLSPNMIDVFTNTYHETDNQIAMAGVSRSAGCTAVCAYVQQVDSQGKRLLFVANAGDSRAVLCRDLNRSGSASNNIEVLTRDHKPSDPQESIRIEAAGGSVIRGRVMGMLAVSRALGDHSLKDFVVSTPEIRSTELGAHDEGCLILCCDGVSDVLSNEEVVSIIQSCYRHCMTREKQTPNDIATLLARELVDRAKAEGSRDNITCLVTLL